MIMEQKENSDNDKNIGAGIRAYRQSLDMTVDEFVEEINKTLGKKAYSSLQIYKYETGHLKVPASLLIDISNACHISIHDLLYYKKEIKEEDLKVLRPNTENDKQKHFLEYFKSISNGLVEGLTIKELLENFENAVARGGQLAQENTFLKGQLDMAWKLSGLQKQKNGKEK